MNVRIPPFLIAILAFVAVVGLGKKMGTIVDQIPDDKYCEVSDSTICFKNDFIFAFQFACNYQVVNSLFEKCDVVKKDVVRKVSSYDWHFILAYVFLLITWSWGLYIKERDWLIGLVIASVFVGLMDILETAHLLWIMEYLDQPDEVNNLTYWLSIFNWAKWIGGFVIVLVLCVKTFRTFWRWLFRLG